MGFNDGIAIGILVGKKEVQIDGKSVGGLVGLLETVGVIVGE